MTDQRTTELDAFLILNASGLTPLRQLALLDAFGTAEAVVGALDADISGVEGLDARHVAAIRRAQRDTDLPALWARLEQLEVRPVPITAQEYPPLLRDTRDATPLLFVQGSFAKRDDLAVAIVGTRKCTPYGVTMARQLAEDLSRRGFTIISGMALGIDGEAHRGALAAGGRTIAVMASGPDITYPPDHKGLRKEIAASGAVVTEYAPGTQPLSTRFPARNRLVSGMALGVIVVEAPARSGALITAQLAGEQGREVFAVPGDVTRPTSQGCHALLKDGAHLTEFATDVVEGLGILIQAVPERLPVNTDDLPADEKAVVDALTFQPRHVDEVVSQTKIPAAKVSACLMLLEMKGIVRRMPGSTYVRL